MVEEYNIAGYCRISVDMEQDRDNASIENQKSIIEDFVANKFPGSKLTFHDDRDRSGYTFEQRENYQVMRRNLLSKKHEILIVKDFSRFLRRNSRGLVELEDLRLKTTLTKAELFSISVVNFCKRMKCLNNVFVKESLV